MNRQFVTATPLNDHRTPIRVLFQVVIGVELGTVDKEVLNKALSKLDIDLTRLTGGVIRFDGRGTWTPGSQTGDFLGNVEHNFVASYLLSVTPEMEGLTLDRVRYVIADMTRSFGLPIQYVHVDRVVGESRNFSVLGACGKPGA